MNLEISAQAETHKLSLPTLKLKENGPIFKYNGQQIQLRTENNKHVLFLSNKILVFFCGSGRFTLTSKCPQPGLEFRALCEISYLW